MKKVLFHAETDKGEKKKEKKKKLNGVLCIVSTHPFLNENGTAFVSTCLFIYKNVTAYLYTSNIKKYIVQMYLFKNVEYISIFS